MVCSQKKTGFHLTTARRRRAPAPENTPPGTPCPAGFLPRGAESLPATNAMLSRTSAELRIKSGPGVHISPLAQAIVMACLAANPSVAICVCDPRPVPTQRMSGRGKICNVSLLELLDVPATTTDLSASSIFVVPKNAVCLQKETEALLAASHERIMAMGDELHKGDVMSVTGCYMHLSRLGRLKPVLAELIAVLDGGKLIEFIFLVLPLDPGTDLRSDLRQPGVFRKVKRPECVLSPPLPSPPLPLSPTSSPPSSAAYSEWKFEPSTKQLRWKTFSTNKKKRTRHKPDEASQGNKYLVLSQQERCVKPSLIMR